MWFNQYVSTVARGEGDYSRKELKLVHSECTLLPQTNNPGYATDHN